MHQFNQDNLICIHLNIFSTYELIVRMCKDNNLDVNPKYIWDFKMNGYHKIWIDKVTYEIIFWTETSNKKIVCLNKQYIQYLRDLKSLVHTKIEKETDGHFETKTPLKSKSEVNQTILDIILDKISSGGLDSLSDRERDFLDKYNG
jgi:hypothetical protein